MTNLSDWMKEDLQKSGIFLEQAKNLGIEPTGSQKCRELLCAEYKDEAGKPVEGYMIPFRDPVTDKPKTYGKGSPYIRLRLKEPARMKEDKPAKYLSPKGAGQHVYILKQVHEAIGSGKPVILTEGEKKAICATQDGLPCIGLVGNWGWKTGGTDTLLPELAAYAKAGTTWYVIWDSDASRKLKEFLSSSCRLAKVLTQYNVTLKMVILPDIEGINKTGLDDFAMSKGASFKTKIQKLLDKAKEVSGDKRSYTSRKNGKKGGRPPVITDIADEFFKKMKEDGKHIVHYHGTWYVYRSGEYSQETDDNVESLIMGFLRKRHRNHANITMRHNVLEHMKTLDLCGLPSNLRIPCNLKSPDSKIPHYLVMENCFVAPVKLLIPQETEKSVVGHSPDYFLTHKVPYAYDPHAECPEWEKCVTTLLPDPEDRKMLQMLFGLGLVPDTHYNVFFILHGPAGTGKTVVAKVLRNVVGDDNVSAVSLNRLNERFALYPLTEKLLNLIDDSDPIEPSMISKAEGLLKDICSGGFRDVEQKFQKISSRDFSARCVYVANHLPQFRDSSDGVWDRIRIIPFNKIVRKTAEETSDLARKLVEAELSGIFNWAIRGLCELSRLVTFPESKVSVLRKQKLRHRCDPVRSFFDERVKLVPNVYISTNELYGHYKTYCTEQSVGAISKRVFDGRLQDAFPDTRSVRKRADGKQAMVWEGLSLVGSSDESEDTQEQIIPPTPELPGVGALHDGLPVLLPPESVTPGATSLAPDASAATAVGSQNGAPTPSTGPVTPVGDLPKQGLRPQNIHTAVSKLKAPVLPPISTEAETDGGISTVTEGDA